MIEAIPPVPPLVQKATTESLSRTSFQAIDHKTGEKTTVTWNPGAHAYNQEVKEAPSTHQVVGTKGGVISPPSTASEVKNVHPDYIEQEELGNAGLPTQKKTIEVRSGEPQSPSTSESSETYVAGTKVLTEPLPMDGGTIEVRSEAPPKPTPVDKVEPGDYLGGN